MRLCHHSKSVGTLAHSLAGKPGGPRTNLNLNNKGTEPNELASVSGPESIGGREHEDRGAALLEGYRLGRLGLPAMSSY